MQKPANKKLMEMVRSAGTPMDSRSPLVSPSARNIDRNRSGASWKAKKPRNMIPMAYMTLSLMVLTIRSGFLAP